MAEVQPQPELEAAETYIKENEAVIATEVAKPLEIADAEPATAAPATAAAPAKEEVVRLSTLQKINNLNVANRVKLAFLGNKEERMILIRDGSKVVSGAVLASPKISDQEVETIAGMKNVQESVLRDLARNRRFVKKYSVVRNLVNNPRTPLDLSLTFMKNLLPVDLKGLSMNKNVPETLRKMALRSFKEKTAPPGQKGG